MKIYVAGRLASESIRKLIEEAAELIENLGFETFVPHRDVGLAKSMEDVSKIFKGDITKGFEDIDLVVAVLDGLHVGAGTAWELGYAYANKIPCIGLKTDEPVSECLDSLSAILIGSMQIVNSLDKLKDKLEQFKSGKTTIYKN